MTDPRSKADVLKSWPEKKRQSWLQDLTDEQAYQLRWSWDFWGRPAQRNPPGNHWHVWLILAGRGWGKSYTGAQWIRERVESGEAKRIALVGRTASDCRDVMVEGPSGVLNVCPPWMKPNYEPSKRRLTWPNGAVATTFSADEPEMLRGPKFDTAWVDEQAAWKTQEAWTQLSFDMQLGKHPRVVTTTTPRPIALIKELAKLGTTYVTRGSTYDNAKNLPPGFLEEIKRRYEGTALGRQEIYAELLDEMPDALWTRTLLESTRVATSPALTRIVVGVDPAISGDGNETGIVVAGQAMDGHFYVIDDCTIRATPDRWAHEVIETYRQHRADRIVVEVNQGGDLVRNVLTTVDPNASIKSVRASRGKIARAEPIAALYEQNKAHHVGVFPDMEDQLCSFVPGGSKRNSPDRLDALVWALTELSQGTSMAHKVVVSSAGVRASPWRI